MASSLLEVIEAERRWDCLVQATIFIFAFADRFTIGPEGVGDLSIIIWRFIIIFCHSFHGRSFHDHAFLLSRALLSNLAEALRVAIGHGKSRKDCCRNPITRLIGETRTIDRSGFPILYAYLDLSERMLKSGGVILGEEEFRKPLNFGLNLRHIVSLILPIAMGIAADLLE